MNPASNLFLVGPMAAGKSSLGRRVARHYGLAFFDLDHEIVERTGASVNLIFEHEGEAGFRRRESTLLAELCARDGIVLATGGGSVLAAENRDLLRERGFVVWLRATVAQQLERTARDRSRPLLRAPDRAAQLVRLAADRDPLYTQIADLVLDSSAGSPATTAQRICTALDRAWLRQSPASVA